MLNHKTTNLDSLSMGSFSAYEFNLLKKTLGKKKWHHIHNYPEIGGSIFYFDLNKQDIFGNCFAFLIHQTFDITKKNRFSIHGKLGTGVGFFTRTYHKKNNPENVWIGSTVNGSMYGSLSGRYYISKKVNILTAATFTHFSNGAIKMPNLGINLPSLTLGIQYKPFPESYQFKKDTISGNIEDKFHINILGSIGFKESGEPDGERYTAYMGSAWISYDFSRKSRIDVGLDGFYDLSHIAIINENKEQYRKKNGKLPNIFRLGLFTGYEFVFNKFSFINGAGYYLYKDFDYNPRIYFRTGFKYQLCANWFLGAFLKTHYGVADNFQWTTGLTF